VVEYRVVIGDIGKTDIFGKMFRFDYKYVIIY